MKPILFNTEMVRAILEDRKTVTRRVVRPQPHCYGPSVAYPKHEAKFFLDQNAGWLRCSDCGNFPQYSHEGTEVCHFWTPPYHPGDILYVRETWAIFPVIEDGSVVAGTRRFYYKADEDNRTDGWTFKWRPSIHMPREAARIFLRVKSVKVERLRDIKEWEAVDEGAVNRPQYTKRGDLVLHRSYIKEFSAIWDSTIKPADRAIYGWEASPWVWVISFERCEKPEEI